jgi:hypothetical protein
MKIVFLDLEALLTDIGVALHAILPLLIHPGRAVEITMIHILGENPIEAAVRLMVVVVARSEARPEARPETTNDIIVLLLGLGQTRLTMPILIEQGVGVGARNMKSGGEAGVQVMNDTMITDQSVCGLPHLRDGNLTTLYITTQKSMLRG